MFRRCKDINGGHIVRVGHGDILVYEALHPLHKYILNSGQFGDNHNFGRAEGGLDHC